MEIRGSWALNDVLIWPLADLLTLHGWMIVSWRWRLITEWHVFRFPHIAVVPENLAWTPFEDAVWEQTGSKGGFALLRERERGRETRYLCFLTGFSSVKASNVRAREMEHKKKRGQRQVENIMLRRDGKFLSPLQKKELIRNPDERKLIIKVCREAGLICILICK